MVERRTVDAVVVGSNPIIHPSRINRTVYEEESSAVALL